MVAKDLKLLISGISQLQGRNTREIPGFGVRPIYKILAP